MGTGCVIRVASDQADTGAFRTALGAAMDEIRRIERRYSRYLPDSIVSRINAGAGGHVPVLLDPETEGLLEFAAFMHRASQGCFDITTGVLRHAWDFSSPTLPDAGEIDHLLGLVGWHRVDRRRSRVRLPIRGMEIDLGGLGKEYAADRAAAILQAAGLRHGFVNLGGDIRLLGPRPDGSPWRLGITHPRRTSELCFRTALQGGALATSGDYQRGFELDGRRYCHLLDPRTGWPCGHWQSMTVVETTCLAAGAICTAAMVMGPEASTFLSAQRVQWLGIDAQGEHHGNLPGHRVTTPASPPT